MPAIDLEKFYRGYIGAINARNFEAVAELIHDDVSINGVPHKRADVIAALKGIADAVPDFVWTVEDLFVVDDRIAARLQDTGTPKQKFLGQDPTGTSIKFIEFGSYKVRDGRFAEMWFLMDSAAVREQLLG